MYKQINIKIIISPKLECYNKYARYESFDTKYLFREKMKFSASPGTKNTENEINKHACESDKIFTHVDHTIISQ